MTLFETILEQARAQSIPEVIAVIAAVLYLVLAIREHIACWFFAALSTAIYVWLFIEARLYMESILNGFYLVMAGYGYFVWRSGQSDGRNSPVVTWPLKTHLSVIAMIIAISAVNGYLLTKYSDAAFPYVDSLTTWSAIWATFLVARKVLENWWYWLLIDIASAFIYWSRDLQLTSLLFAVYVCMIPFGIIIWTQSMREQQSEIR